jgi:hypothetical protein
MSNLVLLHFVVMNWLIAPMHSSITYADTLKEEMCASESSVYDAKRIEERKRNREGTRSIETAILVLYGLFVVITFIAVRSVVRWLVSAF